MSLICAEFGGKNPSRNAWVVTFRLWASAKKKDLCCGVPRPRWATSEDDPHDLQGRLPLPGFAGQLEHRPADANFDVVGMSPQERTRAIRPVLAKAIIAWFSRTSARSVDGPRPGRRGRAKAGISIPPTASPAPPTNPPTPVFLESIHAGPEARMPVGRQLAGLDQFAERFENQFFARSDVIENFLLEDEKSAVDPDVGIFNRVQRTHVPVRVGVHDVE